MNDARTGSERHRNAVELGRFVRSGDGVKVMTAIQIGLMSIMLLSWLQMVSYGSRATMNRKPGVPYWPGNWEKPGNILFRPHLLTEKGLRARRNCLVWFGVFLAAFAIFGVSCIWYEVHH
jgi:hypothetical protein